MEANLFVGNKGPQAQASSSVAADDDWIEELRVKDNEIMMIYVPDAAQSMKSGLYSAQQDCTGTNFTDVTASSSGLPTAGGGEFSKHQKLSIYWNKYH